ncbi:MAG: CNNM domain-containing protein, partial [Planctomycetota bacterium]|nr:CNNM domain-containing protein [Planctomycetota bacterium]
MEEGLRNLLTGVSLVLLFIFSLADAALQLFSRAKLEERAPGEEDRERLRRRLSDLSVLRVAARTLRMVAFVSFVTACASYVEWSEDSLGGLPLAAAVALGAGLLVAEILPRGIARSRPEGVVRWASVLLYPF